MSNSRSSRSNSRSSLRPESLEQDIPGAFPSGAQADGPSAETSHHTLQQAIYARRAEFTRQKSIRIKVGTWNIAALKGTDEDISGWFIKGKARSSNEKSTLPRNDPSALPSGDEIGLYVLGLQEIVDVSSATEALRPYTDPATGNRFKTAVEHALPTYQLVSEQQLIGMLLLIYAAPDVTPQISAVSTTSVGTGLMGYMGNKGAVTSRILLGETTRLVFVNCHMSAGADKAALDRRNWDWQQIMSRTKFDPVPNPTGIPNLTNESLGDEDFTFWFGDLNYRLTGMPGDDIRRLLTLHIRNEYGLPRDSTGGAITRSSSGTTDTDSTLSVGDRFSDSSMTVLDPEVLPPLQDPASLETTLSSLLPHDELHQQQLTQKAFYDGWQEGKIEFLPTYKYDVGSIGQFDSSEKKRCPSWCDRILYRTRKTRLAAEMKRKDAEETRKKDADMKARGMDHAGDDDNVLFDYDPDHDADNEYGEFAEPELELVNTKDGHQDTIFQEYYTSHQRVLSSDHKPLDSVFRLIYDSVIPELKAKVHQEVAKELDRAENEGRPCVTMIVDRNEGLDSDVMSDDFDNDFEGVNFGDIRYAQSKTRSVTIANTGRVPATISFADRPFVKGQNQGPAPPWLSVYFDRDPDIIDPKLPLGIKDHYTIEPGDSSTVELTLKVAVMELVRSLNEDVSNIDDILVLRVENGRDHFLPIRGRWLKSTFAQSIDKLIKIPEGGIRRLQGQKPQSTSAASTPGNTTTHSKGNAGVMWSTPRELFRLTESIEVLVERVIAEWDMMTPQQQPQGDTSGTATVVIESPPWYLHAAWPFVEDSWTLTTVDVRDRLKCQLFEALDTDSRFDSVFVPETTPLHRLEVFAETLMLFLSSLVDGIIPALTFTQIETHFATCDISKQQSHSIDDERTALLEILAASCPTHNVSFMLLTTMLSRLMSELSTYRASSKEPGIPNSPKKTPSHLPRKSLSLDPQHARTQIVRRSLAALFADMMVRMEDPDKGKDKERKMRQDRRVRFVEVFLGDGEGGF
ncbi:DNase I-like protein [Pseudovirgaria hyperparasitica]|uniref:DNase I-like protein n=1 Tax=Pseudovirgaria hyperparasitica TaxID=470096 RepID=A0A6A6W2T9_9PEZI|nr:DNase I-like protein [Pseudovirgaria hyperparasitica]KAF2755907.1 DNase I-like protein [Pseudovirgaria hyperparasitica]